MALAVTASPSDRSSELGGALLRRDARPVRLERLGPAQGQQDRRSVTPGVAVRYTSRSATLTILTVVPNPWSTVELAAGPRFDSFIYFFIFLATATMAYSSARGGDRLLDSGVWTAAVTWVYLQPETHAALSERVRAATGSDIRLSFHRSRGDSRRPLPRIRRFLLVAMILASAARRSMHLSSAVRDRTRTHRLARYFSPNVVAELSKNNDPLKQVRTQDVAVLFADIVGFTAYSDNRSPTWRSARSGASMSGWSARFSAMTSTNTR